MTWHGVLLAALLLRAQPEPPVLREGKIQERAGITKDAARKDVDDWLKKQQ